MRNEYELTSFRQFDRLKMDPTNRNLMRPVSEAPSNPLSFILSNLKPEYQNWHLLCSTHRRCINSPAVHGIPRVKPKYRRFEPKELPFRSEGKRSKSFDDQFPHDGDDDDDDPDQGGQFTMNMLISILNDRREHNLHADEMWRHVQLLRFNEMERMSHPGLLSASNSDSPVSGSSSEIPNERSIQLCVIRQQQTVFPFPGLRREFSELWPSGPMNFDRFDMEKCIICGEDLKLADYVIYMQCCHTLFHEDCILRHLLSTKCCFLCDFDLTKDFKSLNFNGKS